MTTDEIIAGFSGNHQDIIIYLLSKISDVEVPFNNVVSNDEEVLFYSYSKLWEEIHYFVLYDMGSYDEIQLYIHNEFIRNREDVLRFARGKRAFYAALFALIDSVVNRNDYVELIPMII